MPAVPAIAIILEGKVRMDNRIVIVGAGPAGLVTALTLVKAGLPVLVIERNATLLDDPRAATIHPATLDILDELGIVDKVKEEGLYAPVFQFWDRPSGAMVAEFDHALLKGETRHPYVIQCEQFKLSRIVCDLISANALAEIRFNANVQEIAVVDEGKVRLTVSTPEGNETIETPWLIGCDGGRSTVRKSAGIEFGGFTWPERFVVITTPFDFAAEHGYSYRSYFADPDEWCNCFKVSGYDGVALWRTVFPADPAIGDDELLSRQFAEQKLQRFFPKSSPYEVVHHNIYTVHQRVAETFRKGRVLLAGDSAHINNPIGGMGLNGGVQDAFSLGQKLATVIRAEAGEHVLDLYDFQRRTITTKFVQEQSIQNKKRLEAKDADVRQRNLDELRSIAADAKLAKEFLMRTSMIAAQRAANALTL
ncbi:FAD-dependent oxidoreductase [Agrobacterium vitis]